MTERISDDDDDDFEITPVSPRKPSESETQAHAEPKIVAEPEETTQNHTTAEVLASSDPIPNEVGSNDVIESSQANNLIGHKTNDIIDATETSNLIGQESNDVIDAPAATGVAESEERSSTNETPSNWDDKANFKDSPDVYKNVDFDREKESTSLPVSEKGDFASTEEEIPAKEEESFTADKPEKVEKSSSVFTMERDPDFRNSIKLSHFSKGNDEEPIPSLDQSEATTIEKEDPKKDSSGSQMVSDSLDLPEGKPKQDDPTETESSSENSSTKDVIEVPDPDPNFQDQKRENEEF